MHRSSLTGVRHIATPQLRLDQEEGPCELSGGGVITVLSIILEGVETTCSQCHVTLDPTLVVEVCPACSGKLLARTSVPVESSPTRPGPETDRRGILLPRRHALGGIITPQ